VGGVVVSNGYVVVRERADTVAAILDGSPVITVVETGKQGPPPTAGQILAAAGPAIDTAAATRILDQDTTRRGGVIGAARMASQVVADVVIGDSIGAGVGGTLGSTGWDTILATVENRSAGLADPGPGLILANRDETIYGSLKWDTLTQGASHASLLSRGWLLSTSGHLIADTATFRRSTVYIARQAAGAASVEVSFDGGATYTAPASTTGTGVLTVTSADLTTASSRQVRVRQSGAGSVIVLGHMPYQTGATSGLVVHNLAKGGTTTANWIADTTWDTYLAGLGSTVRRVYVSLGGNDAFAGTSVATAMANLATILGRIRTAVPLAEIVVIAAYRPTLTPTFVAPPVATWATQWVTGWITAASTAGASVINLYGRFGDVGNDAATPDPYALTMDSGLHFGPVGQRAIAEHILERLGLTTQGLAAVGSGGGGGAAASETVAGIVELATTGEATTGTDTARAVTPAGVKSATDARAVLLSGATRMTGALQTVSGVRVFADSDDAEARVGLADFNGAAGLDGAIGFGPGGATAPTAYIAQARVSGELASTVVFGVPDATFATHALNRQTGDARYQLLDSDLSAIAALSTTAYGRSLLALADAAAGRTALGLGTLATASTVTSANITDGTITNIDIAAAAAIDGTKVNYATVNTQGTVEFATDAETLTGVAADRVVSPANLSAKLATDVTVGGDLVVGGGDITATDGSFSAVVSANAGGGAFASTVGAEANPRLTLGYVTAFSIPVLAMGAGGASAPDLSLYRSGIAAGTLSGTLALSDATAATHAVNRQTGDARYIRPALAAIVNADVSAAAAITGTKITAGTDTVRGTLELATIAETTAGTSTTLAVTPAGAASIRGQLLGLIYMTDLVT